MFSRIRTVLMLDDWVLYKLAGVRSSEASAASGSGFLDVKTATWSGRIRDAFDLDPGLFPTLKTPGEVAGRVSRQAAGETGLAAGTPVVVGGADTQCALLGAGLLAPGGVGIAAGTTGPTCVTLDTPLVDTDRGLWTSCHMEPGVWILEANCQWLGSVYEWLHDSLAALPLETSVKADVFGWMDAEAARVPAGAGDTFGLLGPILMDARAFHVVRPGVFLFPPPAHPLSEVPTGIPHLVRSALENLAFALRGNLERLHGVWHGKPELVQVTGGMTRSALFCRILADGLGLPVAVAAVQEGSALGAAVCAAAGVGVFASIKEARKALVHKERVFEPVAENTAVYAAAYDRWVEVYGKLEDL